MYLFEHELNKSTSRYFGITSRRKIVASIQYEQYCAEVVSQAWKWCSDVMTKPPVDYIASLTTCAQFTLEATAFRNLVDVPTAQVLNILLPFFLFGPPDATIEDAFVPSYLDPALCAVLTTNKHLKIQ